MRCDHRNSILQNGGRLQSCQKCDGQGFPFRFIKNQMKECMQYVMLRYVSQYMNHCNELQQDNHANTLHHMIVFSCRSWYGFTQLCFYSDGDNVRPGRNCWSVETLLLVICTLLLCLAEDDDTMKHCHRTHTVPALFHVNYFHSQVVLKAAYGITSKS